MKSCENPREFHGGLQRHAENSVLGLPRKPLSPRRAVAWFLSLRGSVAEGLLANDRMVSLKYLHGSTQILACSRSTGTRMMSAVFPAAALFVFSVSFHTADVRRAAAPRALARCWPTCSVQKDVERVRLIKFARHGRVHSFVRSFVGSFVRSFPSSPVPAALEQRATWEFLCRKRTQSTIN